MKWIGLLALLLSPFVVFAHRATLDQLVRFFPDDAFYYLQPAHNLARLGVATFDGVHPTNGFHPLNFLLITALAAMVDKPGLLRISFIVQAAIVLLSAVAIGQRTFRGVFALGALWAAVISSPVIILFVLLSFGLEAALVVAMTVLLQSCWDRARDAGFQSRSRNAVFGAALGLIVLARIDLAIVGVPFLIWWGLQTTERLNTIGWWRQAATFVVPAGLLVGAYLAVNLATMGHVLPVSAWVKSQLVGVESDRFNPSTGGTLDGIAVTFAPLVVSLGALLVARRRSRDASALAQLIPLNVANVLWYAYLAVAVPWVFRWYLAFPVACMMLTLPAAFRDLFGMSSREGAAKRRLLMAALVVINMATTSGALNWIGNRPTSVSYQLKQVADMLNRTAGSASVTATADAGIVGFFATGRVVNIDGLANNFDFAEHYLLTRRMAAYFEREHVTHYLARLELIANSDAVRVGHYEQAESLLDPSLVLRRDHEAFRTALTNGMVLICFRLVE